MFGFETNILMVKDNTMRLYDQCKYFYVSISTILKSYLDKKVDLISNQVIISYFDLFYHCLNLSNIP